MFSNSSVFWGRQRCLGLEISGNNNFFEMCLSERDFCEYSICETLHIHTIKLLASVCDLAVFSEFGLATSTLLKRSEHLVHLIQIINYEPCGRRIEL